MHKHHFFLLLISFQIFLIFSSFIITLLIKTVLPTHTTTATISTWLSMNHISLNYSPSSFWLSFLQCFIDTNSILIPVFFVVFFVVMYLKKHPIHIPFL